MQLLDSETSLVILGNWNPAILQPNWIVRHGFGTEEELTVLLEFSPIAGMPPRFTIEGLRILATNDHVLVNPEQTTADSLELAENVVGSMLDRLSHTPIRAFGQNFEFSEDDVSPRMSQLFNIYDRLAEQIDFPIDVRDTTLRSSYGIGETTLNFTRKLLADGTARLIFNFHYEVTSAANACELLQGSFVQNFERTNQIVDIYSTLNTQTQEEQNHG